MRCFSQIVAAVSFFAIPFATVASAESLSVVDCSGAVRAMSDSSNNTGHTVVVNFNGQSLNGKTPSLTLDQPTTDSKITCESSASSALCKNVTGGTWRACPSDTSAISSIEIREIKQVADDSSGLRPAALIAGGLGTAAAVIALNDSNSNSSDGDSVELLGSSPTPEALDPVDASNGSVTEQPSRETVVAAANNNRPTISANDCANDEEANTLSPFS